ncbi:MAG: phytanoyl-CoA dioxygenase family protein [Pseudomonadota bacterium]|nr:phytanoyl-CoA dioxygenase family protein [Pseudomonadota bacterium]
MAKILSETQLQQFELQGFLAVLDVFSVRQCEEFRSHSEEFEHHYPDDVSWAMDIKCNLLFDWVYELSTFPLLLEIVSELIGPDVLLTNSIFRIKEPLSSTHYGWHQDAARIQVNPAFVIVYVAISDATTENGCLRVIPGSNQRIEPFHLVSYSERQVARVSHVDESNAVDMVLRQGQVGIFDCNTIHGSSSNNSRNRRFALVNDYTPAAAQQSVGTGSGQLVRGLNSRKLWGEEPKPQGSFSENNIIGRREILNSYPENVLMGPLSEEQQPSFADQHQ